MNNVKRYELSCMYDVHNSFYKKAIVTEEHHYGEYGETTLLNLYSYDTLVAKILISTVSNTIEYMITGIYSQTTTRHQKEFFKQHGLSDKDIKTLLNNKNDTINIVKELERC